MLQHIYPEQIASNDAYSLIGKRAIAGKGFMIFPVTL